MREDLKLQLYNAAIGHANAKSNRFNFYAHAELINFINSGVDRMSLLEYGSDEKKKLAEVNLIRFVDVMINDGRIRRITESLDYESLSNARMSLCPLWPFC